MALMVVLSALIVAATWFTVVETNEVKVEMRVTSAEVVAEDAIRFTVDVRVTNRIRQDLVIDSLAVDIFTADKTAKLYSNRQNPIRVTVPSLSEKVITVEGVASNLDQAAAEVLVVVDVQWRAGEWQGSEHIEQPVDLRSFFSLGG
jgi:hypothetical protein